MQQNQTSNKISSFIGLFLLIGIIGFTIFTNFFSAKSIQELQEEATIFSFKSFTQTDLDNFWKLDSINTETGNVNEKDQQHSIFVSKKIKLLSSNEVIKYDPQGNEKYVVNKIDSRYDFGALKFKTSAINTTNKPLVFESFVIQYCKLEKEYIFMNEIGNLFLNYQIKHITSNSQYGNFTAIHLKDGRIIILLKKDLQVTDYYYKQIIEKANFENDTTKVIFPLEASEIYNDFYTIEKAKVKKKERKKEWYEYLIELI